MHSALQSLAQTLPAAGMSTPDALNQAHGRIYSGLQAQAQTLAYIGYVLDNGKSSAMAGAAGVLAQENETGHGAGRRPLAASAPPPLSIEQG
jgi:hypothetical protein